LNSGYEPDGLHRMYQYGVSKIGNAGLYIYGDVYDSGGTLYSADSSHNFTLSQDISDSGTIFFSMKNLDAIMTGYSGTYPMELVSLNNGELSVVAYYYKSADPPYDYDMKIVISGSNIVTQKTYIPGQFEVLTGWTTVGLVWEYPNVLLYKNGIISDTNTITPLTSPATNLKFMNNEKAVSSGFTLTCIVDELRVYDVAKSISTINNLDSIYSKDKLSINEVGELSAISIREINY